MKDEKIIKFTKDELYWIERTADLECALVMDKFVSLCKIDISKLEDKEKDLMHKTASEYMDLYTFLRELRTKLEMWDCRYGIEKEIKTNKERNGSVK